MKTESYDTDRVFSEKIAALRGGKGFGAVMKGMTWLDWAAFEHQVGPFIIGESERTECEEKLALRRDIIRFQESYWMQNGNLACDMFRMLAKATGGSAKISGLLEDSLFDGHIWLPAALFAELLWDGKTEWNELLGRVARREYI